MMNKPQRSAICAPEMSHSVVVERPRPGVRNPQAGAAYSIASAIAHKAKRACPSANMPAIQNKADSTNHAVMRWKLR